MATAIGPTVPIAVNNVMGGHAPSPTLTVSVPPQALPTPTPTKERIPPAPNGLQHSPLGPPLTVVSEYPIDPGNNVIWIFADKLSLSSNQLAPLDRALAANQSVTPNDYLFGRGGYAPSADTQLILHNNRPYPIQVIDIQVIKHCQAPLTGTLIYAPEGDSEPSTGLGFNLDSSDNDAMLADGPNVRQWKPGYFTQYVVPINPGKQAVFNIRAVASRVACSFLYQVTVQDSKNKISQVISDYGMLFRVSALRLSYLHRPHRLVSQNFSGYQNLYVGGVASPRSDGWLVRENPRTWD